MKIRSTLLPLSLLVLLAAACATGPADPAVAPAAQTQRELPSRVLLVSFDGATADVIRQIEAEGHFSADGWTAVQRNGFSAERMIPVSPTLTAVTHASMITGASPEKTGIVSNTFRMPGTPRTDRISGFDAPLEAETLMEAAKRQGKKVGSVTYPAMDGTTPERTADWGLVYVSASSPSRIVSLRRSDFVAVDWVPPTWSSRPNGYRSYSPVLSTRIRWQLRAGDRDLGMPVDIVVLDTTDDSVENYDTIEIVSGDQRIRPDSKGWFPLSRDVAQESGRARYGSWSKVLELDPKLARVRVYMGSVTANRGYPESYVRMIDDEVGFWPGPPDGRAVEQWLRDRTGGISPEIFLEQLERFSGFFTRATDLSIERMEFDLLLSYQPIVDEAGHQFTMVNERQLHATAENRRTARQVLVGAYRAMDRAIASHRSKLGPGDAIVIVGDHGMTPIDTSVGLNRLLVEWGYAKASGNRLAADTPWAAFTSGMLAHIYRFEEVPGRSTDDLVRRLSALRAPDGSPVIEKIEQRNHTGESRWGNIVLHAWPRFVFDASTEGEVFGPTTYYGQHGGLNTHADLHTVFAAAGKGVERGRVPAVHQTSVARFISGLLGIAPPRNAE
jgi:predicted AlkP superfamily pyrophosphatase or phosphodiesterase